MGDYMNNFKRIAPLITAVMLAGTTLSAQDIVRSAYPQG